MVLAEPSEEDGSREGGRAWTEWTPPSPAPRPSFLNEVDFRVSLLTEMNYEFIHAQPSLPFQFGWGNFYMGLIRKTKEV